MKRIASRLAAAALVALAVAVALLCAGCIKQKVLVQVKPDGTGHIVVTEIYTPRMVKMIEGMSAESRRHGFDADEMPKNPYYDVRALKMAAGRFGAGVRFVKGREFNRGGARGAVAVYEFDNVGAVFVNLDGVMESMGVFSELGYGSNVYEDGEIEIADRSPRAFWFDLEKGEVAALTIHGPGPPPKAPDGEAGDWSRPAFEAEDLEPGMGASVWLRQMGLKEDATEGEMLKTLYGGMEFSVVVQVAGEIVETDASHRDAEREDRVVLQRVELDRILNSPEGPKYLNKDGMESLGGEGPDDILMALNGSENVLYESKETVTVTFK